LKYYGLGRSQTGRKAIYTSCCSFARSYPKNNQLAFLLAAQDLTNWSADDLERSRKSLNKTLIDAASNRRLAINRLTSNSPRAPYLPSNSSNASQALSMPQFNACSLASPMASPIPSPRIALAAFGESLRLGLFYHDPGGFLLDLLIRDFLIAMRVFHSVYPGQVRHCCEYGRRSPLAFSPSDMCVVQQSHVWASAR